MSNERRPYARFYYGDFKRDYPECFADPAVLGTYIQLLSLAEATWPALPDLPRAVRARPLAILVGRGLVAVSGMTYTVKGHSAEREMRSAHASAASNARWNAPSNAQSMPSTSTSTSTRMLNETSTGERARALGGVKP